MNNIKIELAKQATRIVVKQMMKRRQQPVRIVTLMPTPETIYVSSERVR